MGTRGAIGFYRNGVTKVTYNHFDSYPDGVGKDILNEIRGKDIKKLNKSFDSIVLVNNDQTPTKEQIKELKKYSNMQVSTGKLEEWYVLLRNTQGTLKPYLNGELPFMIDSADFLKDSLFCEWAYIVNLNTNKFEVWCGFQKKPNKDRYSKDFIWKEEYHGQSKYYPCKLMVEYDLDKLPEADEFVNAFKGLEELED